jgi:cell wall-associated NlpC family hydrolase
MDYSDLIGTRFKIHGRSKEEGFDCYGLAIEVLRRNGIKMVDVFYDTLDNRKEVHDIIHNIIPNQKIDKAEENCIIEIDVRGEPLHIGVYIGNGKFIHTTSRKNVVIEPLRLYKNKIVGYYKVNN